MFRYYVQSEITNMFKYSQGEITNMSNPCVRIVYWCPIWIKPFHKKKLLPYS